MLKNEKLSLCKVCIIVKSSRLSYNQDSMTRIHSGSCIGKANITLNHVISKIGTNMYRAYKVYLIGVKSIYKIENILEFVPELNKVTFAMNVIFDKIEIVSCNHSVEGIILNEWCRSINGFSYLINMIYRDNDNSCLNVLTRLGISHSSIVAYDNCYEIEIMHHNHHVDGINLEASMTSPTYLINMIYKDTYDNCYYVMRKIGVKARFVIIIPFM